MFYLLMPSLDSRQRFIAHLKVCGIQAVFHYIPLHMSEMGRRFGGRPGQCPVSEDTSQRVVRLPFYNELAPALQDQVIESVRAFPA
jgi:dTDP-4-amino-4,6-dideoxygalactose transaminase